MKWRSKQRMKQGEPHPLVTQLVRRIRTQLRTFATLLNEKANRYSPKKQRQALALFCLLCLSGCVGMVIQSFQKGAGIPVVISPITAMPLRQGAMQQPGFSSHEQRRIHQLKIYLDSARRTATGKHGSDSFLQARPHLLDTLRYIDTFFQKQQNK